MIMFIFMPELATFRCFTVSSLSLRLLQCLQMYDYEDFQHFIVQAIWQQVAELPKHKK